MGKTVCFGELMLRLTPPASLLLRQANDLNVSFAGAEANVAVALKNLGNESAFVSKYAQNPIGEASVQRLRAFGVDTRFFLPAEGRMGLYYYEKGAGARSARVVYDRAGSVFALSKAEDYDWEEIFADADWFHFSGITPALGWEMPAILLTAAKAAAGMGVCVSCDVNYRAALWSKERARKAMETLLPYVKVCAGAEDLFAEEGEPLEETDARLRRRFGIELFVHAKRRMLSATRTQYGVVLCGREGTYASPMYELDIVDRLGCGDAMFAGLIHAYKTGKGLAETASFAAAVGALKHSTDGDFSYAKEADVYAFLSGGNGGRVQR